MNPLIQELAIKAEGTKKHVPAVWQFYDSELQEFAGMLVQECISIILQEKEYVQNQKVFNQYDETWNRARVQQSQRIAIKIAEHFGD